MDVESLGLTQGVSKLPQYGQYLSRIRGVDMDKCSGLGWDGLSRDDSGYGWADLLCDTTVVLVLEHTMFKSLVLLGVLSHLGLLS